MFADPQTVTVNAVAQTMPRVETDGQKSVYSKADGSYKLTISHSLQKDKIRSVARLDFRAVVADPLTAVNDYETQTTYLVIERPNYGFTMVQLEQQIAGFKTWLDNAAIDKLFGTES